MALVQPEKVTSAADRDAIAHRTKHHASPAEFFIETLAEGVGTIAAAFYPKPVIVRLSDFKTNEYARLIGGANFEPKEENPMIGFRGASRYAHPAYAPGFALECAALRRVREVMGLQNLRVMVPFCRRVEEARRVIAAMAENGLTRGEHGLEIYVMCEIPNNVIQIDAFAQLFDGFSIGSNDLTQLTLGVDRDSEIVAFDFDERDPGMLEMLRLAVAGAKRNHRHIGICGEAPADYPEIARFVTRARHRFDQRQSEQRAAHHESRKRRRTGHRREDSYGRMKTSGESSSRFSAAAVSSAAISSFERAAALNRRIASDKRQRATTSSETDCFAASANADWTCLETISYALIDVLPR